MGTKVGSPVSLLKRDFARARVTCSLREIAPASAVRFVRCFDVYASLRPGWLGRSAALVRGASSSVKVSASVLLF
jgi:hypothetical protein